MTLAVRRIVGSYVPPVLSPGDQTSAREPFSATALYDFVPISGIEMEAATFSASDPCFFPIERNEMGNRPGDLGTTSQSLTKPSVTYIHGQRDDRVKARFRMLRRLPSNHDGEGAAAPNPKTIDRAIAFIDRIATRAAPRFNATLDDDGSAVIEFEDRTRGFFADITFRADGSVEFYKREPGQESEFFEGSLETPEAREFLESKIGLVV
jgi:hypothetical protein